MTFMVTSGHDGTRGSVATWHVAENGTPLLSSNRSHDARALHLATAGDQVYACLVDDTVVAWDVDPSGSLGRPRAATLPGLPCHSAVVGRHLFVSLYQAGEIAVLDRWTLREARRIRLPGAERGASRPHQALPAPDGTTALVVDAGTDSILALDTANDLEPVAVTHVDTGTAPRNGVFADETRVFVTGEASSSIIEFRYLPEQRTLEPQRTRASSWRAGARPAAITAGLAAVYQTNRATGTIRGLPLHDPDACWDLPVGAGAMSASVARVNGQEFLWAAAKDRGIVTVHPLSDGAPTPPALARLAIPGASAVAALDHEPRSGTEVLEHAV